MKIYKYPIQIIDVQEVEMTINADILTAQMQGPHLCLWAKVEERHTSTEVRTIEVFGTGHLMDSHARIYIGTVQTNGGSLVWHVFERI